MCLPLSHPLSSPFPFPLCVCHVIHPHVCHHSHVLSCLPSVCEARHMHCVCAACHTPTLCPAVLLPLLSSLSVSLPPPSPSFLGASVRERKECGERGKEEEERCVIQKGMQKGSTNTAKRRRHLVFPPCLQPLSKPRPFTLHFTHHTTSRAFLLVWLSLFLQKHTLIFTSTQEVSGLCDVKQPHKSATPFLVPTLFLLFPLSSCHFTSLLPLCPCGECPSPIHPTNVSKPCVSHPHFLLVPRVCAVVSTLTTAPSHSLIPSFIGCLICVW